MNNDDFNANNAEENQMHSLNINAPPFEVNNLKNKIDLKASVANNKYINISKTKNQPQFYSQGYIPQQYQHYYPYNPQYQSLDYSSQYQTGYIPQVPYIPQYTQQIPPPPPAPPYNQNLQPQQQYIYNYNYQQQQSPPITTNMNENIPYDDERKNSKNESYDSINLVPPVIQDGREIINIRNNNYNNNRDDSFSISEVDSSINNNNNNSNSNGINDASDNSESISSTISGDSSIQSIDSSTSNIRSNYNNNKKNMLPTIDEDDNNSFVIRIDKLSQFIDETMIKDLFSMVGNIKAMKIFQDKKRFALVEYLNEESAIKAIQKFNGMKYKGEKLLVFWSKEKIEVYKIIIDNLPHDITKEKIDNICSIAGEIESIEIERPIKPSDKSRCAVIFKEKESVSTALEILQDSLIDEIPIIVTPDTNDNIKLNLCENKVADNNNNDNYKPLSAPTPLQHTPRNKKEEEEEIIEIKSSMEKPKSLGKEKESSSVFVGCLNEDVNENDLKSLFSGCGEIESVKLFRQNGKKPDYAYVNYKNADSVNKAIKKYNSYNLNGRYITVQYSKKKKHAKTKI